MEDTAYTLGQFEIRLKHLEAQQNVMAADLRTLVTLAAEIRGGKKVALIVVAALSSIFGAAISWLLAKL